jgi:hypothetical protein
MTNPVSFLVLATGLFFSHGSLLRDMLAAAGGALLGGLFTAFVLVLMFKAVRVKKVPRRTTVALSIVGGLIAGWLVWQWTAGGGFGPGPSRSPPATIPDPPRPNGNHPIRCGW